MSSKSSSVCGVHEHPDRSVLQDTHTVMQGDTLESLAERYLGSKARRTTTMRQGQDQRQSQARCWYSAHHPGRLGDRKVAPCAGNACCSCSHSAVRTILPREATMTSEADQVQAHLRTIDQDPGPGHSERTPSVARLIAIGRPALVPILPLLSAPSASPGHARNASSSRSRAGCSASTAGTGATRIAIAGWPGGRESATTTRPETPSVLQPSSD
jgi:hypothetical protein